MIDTEMIEAVSVGLSAGERCLVFNNNVDIVNNVPYYQSAQAVHMDYAAFESSNLAIFEQIASNETPIGYGLVTSVRGQIANILFIRFPKLKNEAMYD